MRGGAAFALVALLALAACNDASEVTPAREPAAPAPEVAATPPSEGEVLLERITRAEHDVAYAGYKTAVHGADGEGRQTSMRVARFDDGRMVLEWKRGDESGRRWVVRARHRWIDDPRLLLQNYRVTLVPGAQDEVCGRMTRRVELRPLREGRPTLSLLVDVETDLVLAERLQDHDGVVRFAWHFDSIEYGTPKLDVEEAEIVAAPQEIEADPAKLDWATLVPGRLPEGFERVAARTQDDGAFVEYFSDGLAAFALRQIPTERLSADRDGELERRACSGRASVSGTIEGVDVTLLGNLPIDELEAVAADLRVRP